MSKSFRRLIFKVIVAAAALVVTGCLIFTLVVPGKYIPVLPWMLAFFALLTIGFHGYQLRLAKKDMARFVRYSMIITFVRLLIYSLFAIIYLSLRPENAPVFVVCLVLVYLIFSFIEVADLSRIIKQNNRK
jgi:hypothetical protein